MLGDAVVPNDDSAALPLNAGLEVGTQGEVVVEELEQGVGLFFFEADNLASD